MYLCVADRPGSAVYLKTKQVIDCGEETIELYLASSSNSHLLYLASLSLFSPACNTSFFSRFLAHVETVLPQIVLFILNLGDFLNNFLYHNFHL